MGKRTAMYEHDDGLHIPLRKRADLVIEEPCAVGDLARMMKLVRKADRAIPPNPPPVPAELTGLSDETVEAFTRAAGILDGMLQRGEEVNGEALQSILELVAKARPKDETPEQRTAREDQLRSALEERKVLVEARQDFIMGAKEGDGDEVEYFTPPYAEAFLAILRLAAPDADPAIEEADLYPWVVAGGWSTQLFNFMMVPSDGSAPSKNGDAPDSKPTEPSAASPLPQASQ